MADDDFEGNGTKVTQVSDLDFSNPLYLHSSDTSITALISLKLEGTENYNVWSRAMLLALQTKNKSGFIDGQVFSKFAKTVWDELKETYDKIDESITFNLHKKINTISQNGDSLSDYYHKLNALWKQFDALVKLPSCGCANTEFKSHNDLIKLMQFLMGLDDCYQAVRSNILTKETLSFVQTTFSIAFREESHINSSSVSSSGSALKSQQSAFLVCYEIVGYPSGWVKRNNNNTNRNVTSNNVVSTSNNQGSAFTSDQNNKLMSLINDTSVTGSAQANVAGMIVGHPNGTQALITKIGDLTLNDNNTLSNVLVVLGYRVNLPSVHQLSKNKRIFVGFNDSKCYIHDLLEKRIVGTGSVKNGLYLFDVFEGDYSNCVTKCYVSFNLWHCRLGHPIKRVLNLLKHDLEWSGDSNDHICDTCHKAKKTREPFPLSDHKSTALGDLIHLELWGPYKITSRDVYKYFLTVVDDFSRAVWVYRLKFKSDVFDMFEMFSNLLLNLSDKYVKIIRSDNEIGFVNSKFDLFCKNKGIVNQTTCAYTPQQNGIAKRKHRHLLNVARASVNPNDDERTNDGAGDGTDHSSHEDSSSRSSDSDHINHEESSSGGSDTTSAQEEETSIPEGITGGNFNEHTDSVNDEEP
ncbi:uncharacterized protein [Rutidosis leptorrhynchoides]|uniref:uncharacterized protein n=1 Tax=Rutidosis leptorrhynchoides TaxID=125765 RepID=UPI003A9A23F4